MGQKKSKPAVKKPGRNYIFEGVVSSILDTSVCGYTTYQLYIGRKLKLYPSHPNYIQLHQHIKVGYPYQFVSNKEEWNSEDQLFEFVIEKVREVPTYTINGKIKGFLSSDPGYKEIILTTSPIPHIEGFY